MKQSILFLAFIFISFSNYAQSEKGDFAALFQVSPFPTNGNNDIGLINVVGGEYFLSQKLSLGAQVFFSNNTWLKSDSGREIQSIGFLISGQYLFLNQEKWRVFAQATAGLGKASYKYIDIEKQNLLVGSFGPGVNYFLNDNIHLKLTTPYFIAQNTSRDFTEVRGVGLFIGLGYTF